MKKIKLHYLLGDVHMGGHDVHRIARGALKLLNAAGCFDVLVVCDGPGLGDIGFDDYFQSGRINEADAFIFNCGNWRFNIPAEQKLLEDAVAAGAGFMLMHGDHPCYWPAAGMAAWEGFERMAGFVWREKTSHGDFGNFHISVTQPDHPIMRGLSGFDTRDEVFCTMENPHNVPYEVLATAYSDSRVISRHGQAGTGREEPIAIIGSFGKGRTYNQGLGHVWPYYTGHGLGEDTMISWMPLEHRIMFVRACEWIATGAVTQTRDFRGNIPLFDVEA
jgi:type 1 glutamine amidotransferase